MPEAQQTRVAPSSMDWYGNILARWTMTPSSQTDAVHVEIPEPDECVPLYPLRYGLSVEGCALNSVGSNTIGEYPSAPVGKAWGLRLLRPQSFIYLMYHEGSKFHALPFQVTSDGRFAPLPEDGEERTSDEADASPYLPAPRTDVADTVYLMATDTRLTEGSIEQLSSRLDALSGKVVTKVKPADSAKGQQDVAMVKGCLDHHLELPEMTSLRYEWQGLDMRWSESLHDVPAGFEAVDCLERLSRRLNQGDGKGQPLAPVVHDAVGILSELNSLLGKPLEEAGEYTTDASRKLRVREQIIALGEQKYLQTEREARDQANETNVRANYYTDPDDYSREKAEAAKARRWESYRKADADAFHAAHDGKLEGYKNQITQAAGALWSVWQGLKDRYQLTIDLHDDSDTRNFLDLRLVVANTLLGLAYHEEGEAWLKSQLGEDSPIEGTILYRVVAGHPALQQYLTEDKDLAEQRFPEETTDLPDMTDIHSTEVDLTKGLERSLPLRGLNEVNKIALLKLQTLMEALPPDGASAKLSTVIAALVDTGKLRAPQQFYISRFRAVVEAAEGSLLVKGKLPAADIGNWVLREYNGNVARGFRNVTVFNARREMATAYATYQVKMWDEAGPTLQGLRFWHNVKWGLGVAGILSSSYTLQSTLAKLHEDDAITLTNSLNFGAATLLTGASGATLNAVRHEVTKNAARVAERSAVAGGALEGLANRWTNIAVGLTAGAALLQAISDYDQAMEESGTPQFIKFLGVALQGGAAGLGALHLLGKVNETFVSSMVRFSTQASTRVAVGTGVRALGRVALTRTAGMAVGGLARIASLGAGPVGWILFGVQTLYTVLKNWHDGIVEEQRYTDWIARSIWGTGRRSTSFWGLRGGEELSPYGDDAVEEMRDFDRLWQKPTKSSDRAWLKILASGTLVGVPTPPSPETRAVSVLFPGWKPQVSWYEIDQYGEFDWMGVEKSLNGRDNVEVEEGFGILTFQTSTVIGNTRIKYYPNYEASPDFYLTNSDDDGNDSEE